MEIGINDILLHYEEFGDFDYKINITLFLVTKYIQAVTGTTEAYAKKQAMSLRDPLAGWAKVMDADERFYEWCKRRFYNKAMSKRSKSKNYSMFWIDDRGNLKRYDFVTKNSAFVAFERKKDTNVPVLLYIRQSNGRLRSMPIKRYRPTEIIEKVEDMLVQERYKNMATEVIQCQKRRQVRSCNECLRFGKCNTSMEGNIEDE